MNCKKSRVWTIVKAMPIGTQFDSRDIAYKMRDSRQCPTVREVGSLLVSCPMIEKIAGGNGDPNIYKRI